MGCCRNRHGKAPVSTPRTIISKALLRALREMRDAEARDEYEDAEIVRSAGECWLGSRRISPATLNEGLRLCLFHSEGIGTAYERHELNEDGRALAADPHHYLPHILRLVASE